MASDSKLASLQVVRALAAWTVVFHHYVQLFYDVNAAQGLAGFFWHYGKLGVDVFFVLSGFVMCLMLQKSKKGPVVFMIDRLFRIAPAYWFFTVMVIVSIYFFPRGFFYTSYNLESLVKAFLFLPGQNPSGIGLFPLLTVGWTLNFEMFFYVVLVCCMMISRQWALTIFFVLFAVFPYVYPVDAPLATIGRHPQLHEFWVGAVLAVLWENSFASKSRQFPRLALVAGAASLYLGIYMLGRGFPIVFALSVLVAALACEHYLKYNSLPVRALVYLGQISYSTYLAHCVVIGVAIHLFGKEATRSHHVAMLLVTVIGTYAASVMSYRWLENNHALGSIREGLIRFFSPKAGLAGLATK